MGYILKSVENVIDVKLGRKRVHKSSPNGASAKAHQFRLKIGSKSDSNMEMKMLSKKDPFRF